MNLFVENLHKTYDKKAVVDGISFEITSGETIGCLLYTSPSPRD